MKGMARQLSSKTQKISQFHHPSFLLPLVRLQWRHSRHNDNRSLAPSQNKRTI
jgi:hypothetical protein